MKKSDLFSVRNWIFGLDMKKKFMFSFLLIIVLACGVIGGVATSVSSNYLKNETLSMSGQLVYHVLLNVDYRAAEFEKLANQMVSHYRFQQIAKSYTVTRSQTETYLDASAMGTIISSTTISHPDILKINVMMANGSLFSWEKGNPKVGIKQLVQEEQGDLDQLVFALGAQPAEMIWKRTEQGHIQFIRKIIDTNQLTPLGVVVFEMESDHFRLSLPAYSAPLNPTNTVVLNRHNDMLVSAEDPLIAPLVDYALQQEQLGNRLSGETFRYEGADYMMVQANTPYSKWKVLAFIPLQNIWDKVDVIAYSILVTGIAILLTSSLLAWYLSGGITRNIGLLKDSMKKVEKGDFNVRVRPVNQDEIGKLALQFNYMVGRISDLVQEVADERIMRQAKEYEVLQTQVSPHFLYNTLGSIKSLAQLNGQQDIVKMTTYLVELLKAALNNKKNLWMFNNELSFVDLYIDLQKVRYEDHFRVEYDIAEDTEDLCVVGFTLQPLVENALYHAFELDKPGGVIRIGSRIEEDGLRIWVGDNGKGMSPEALLQMMTRKSKNPRGLNSIGVKNVDERIKYCFGEQYGLSYESEVGKGTTVYIRLPIVREEVAE